MKRSPMKRGKGFHRGPQPRKTIWPLERMKLEREWRRKILDLDHMTCRLCHIKATTADELEAHHIAMRSQRPDLKYDIYNGAALHPFCHSWVHRNRKKAIELGLLSTETYEKARKDESIKKELTLSVGISVDQEQTLQD